MSEEILEQQSEEELEEQNAVVEPSDDEINEAKAKSEEMEDGEEEEEEMEESFQTPKTKAGMVKAIYDQLNSMKKAELSDSFSKIMGATSLNEEEEEEDDEEEVKAGYKMENKKLKKEDLDLDVKEDMDAIMNGEELSEDFKTKAATIFEAAVSAKVISEVNQRVDALEEEFKKEIQEAKEEYKSNMSEKVDGYLNYVVEEWMKENELAVERGIRSELVEDFMTGLKNLFQEHYIDIPEEKVDLVDDLFEKVEDLEKQLDETVNNSVEMKKELAEFKKQEALRDVSEELADTEKEKLQKLSEGVDYEDSEQYKEKLEVIKENYFPKGEDTPQPLTEEVENNESEELVEEIDASVSFYAERLKRHNNK
tara:strand:- start:22 stop:1122 length:1101 start_codon:yes stop_codon:yes gene_type:complete